MIKRIAFSLSKRVTLGYVIIIAVSLISSTYCIYELQQNKTIDNKIQNSYWPMYLRLKDFQTLNNETAKLTNHWVYQPNSGYKHLLRQLVETDYYVLKIRINQLIDCQSERHAKIITDLFVLSDTIVHHQHLLMKTLSTDSAYADDRSVDRAISIWSQYIEPGSREMDRRLGAFINAYGRYLEELQEKKEQADTSLSVILIATILIFVAAFIFTYAFAQKHIVQPIAMSKDLLVKLSQGQPIELLPVKRRDEIGAMMRAMNCLSRDMNTKSTFADHIGKGMYHEQFKPLSPDDLMGKSLLNMRDQLRKRNAELDRLVYSASHDLRAPITSVKGLLTVIRMDRSEANFERCIALVNRSMDRLDKVIHEIVDFFRNARSDVKDTPVDIAQLIDNVLELVSGEPGFEEMDFVVQCPDVVILSDVKRLELVFKNLIANAIQFRRRDGEPKVTVEVLVSDYLTFTVSDNGPGIPDALHERIFDMFFRGSDLSSGSGMGLYIVKEVVATLRGSISLTSVIGNGATFTVRVPLKTQSDIQDHDPLAADLTDVYAGVPA